MSEQDSVFAFLVVLVLLSAVGGWLGNIGFYSLILLFVAIAYKATNGGASLNTSTGGNP